VGDATIQTAKKLYEIDQRYQIHQTVGSAIVDTTNKVRDLDVTRNLCSDA
jgi:hypothetical protein